MAVTVQLNGPVPDAVNAWVPCAGIETAAGETVIGCAAPTITVTVADFDLSSCDVAVTVTFPVALGAVNTLP